MADQQPALAAAPCGQSKEWHDVVADLAFSGRYSPAWTTWARETARIDQEVHRDAE